MTDSHDSSSMDMESTFRTWFVRAHRSRRLDVGLAFRAGWRHRDIEIARLQADLEHARQIVGAQAVVIDAARVIVPEGSRHGILAWRQLQKALKALGAADVPTASGGEVTK